MTIQSWGSPVDFGNPHETPMSQWGNVLTPGDPHWVFNENIDFTKKTTRWDFELYTYIMYTTIYQ